MASEDRVLVFNEGHPVDVVLASDDEDSLAGAAIGVRILQDVEQVATLDVEDDVVKPDAALFPELRILRVVPGEVLDSLEDARAAASWARSRAAGALDRHDQ